MAHDRSLGSLALTTATALPLAALLCFGAVTGGGELTRCNMFDDAATTWAAVRAGSDKPLPLRSLDPPVLLPDGSEFKTWEQPPTHRRTFFVAHKHPNASDDNPGTEARPWKTIGRAAATLEPGDRVIVKQGLYREWVRPARGGTGPTRMITYQAAPGEKVVIRGSERYAGPWLPSTCADKPKNPKAWLAVLPDTLFDGTNPFAETNLLPYQGNPYWSKKMKQRRIYSMAQGLVFQDGRRLKQTADYEDLAKAPGTYWVEPGGWRLHIRPFGDKRPSTAAFELTTRPFAFAPDNKGLGFIRCEGFTIEYVASCFPIPQRGAISTRQGHHWIVENNVVRQANALGLDFGRRPTFIPYTVPADTPALAGVGHIVRRNRFLDCGICSMQGLGLIGGLLEGNFSSGCGWHNVPRLFETGGIKLHYCKHALVRGNVVHGTIGGAGLWVDHSNANTRITANIVVGARSPWGGLFLEASYRPNLIDHNIVWGCTGHAFYQHDCENLIVANNLFGECTGLPVLMRSAGTRIVDIETKRRASAQHNRIVGNIFYGFTKAPHIPAGDNLSDHNIFVQPPGKGPLDLAAWRTKTGREAHSIAATARIEFSPAEWTLRSTPPLPSLQCPRIPALTHDLFGAARQGPTTPVGPSAAQNPVGAVDLRAHVLRHLQGR